MDLDDQPAPVASGPRNSPPPLEPSASRVPGPPSARQGSWRGWFWICIFLTFAVIVSLGLNVVLGIAAADSPGKGGGSLKGFQTHLVDGDPAVREFIAVVPVQGLIMEMPSEDAEGKGSLTRLKLLLKELKKPETLKNLKGVLLLVDSPGGGVTTSDVMYHELSRFKKETSLPVLALFQDVAASGGYYVSMSADHIMAHQTSLTGSIGVISQFYNVSELVKKLGVKVNTIKSLNFKNKESFKDMGSPYRPMRPEEEKILQDLVTEMWQRFTHVVAEGRKGQLTLEEVQKLADGRIYTAPQALKLKLIDSIGYPDDAYSKIRDMAKADNAKIVRFSKEKSWEDLFNAQAKVPGLGVLEKVLGNSEEPRLLYLWDGP